MGSNEHSISCGRPGEQNEGVNRKRSLVVVRLESNENPHPTGMLSGGSDVASMLPRGEGTPAFSLIRQLRRNGQSGPTINAMAQTTAAMATRCGHARMIRDRRSRYRAAAKIFSRHFGVISVGPKERIVNGLFAGGGPYFMPALPIPALNGYGNSGLL